eukprot:comp19350_c0_seq1/m.22283 comp19350_c0_seq1/g.22283  ORF comp19350_c0_seq1/g.22283 comp19350_c0_seq1/m.22283 type:complete len:319 (-) comp19350_c0_seq1:587-1543(-)
MCLYVATARPRPVMGARPAVIRPSCLSPVIRLQSNIDLQTTENLSALLFAEARLATSIITACFGVYVIPQDQCPCNIQNPLLSEIRTFYRMAAESPDPSVSGANFLSWGILFHITVAGFVEPNGAGEERTLSDVVRFFSELHAKMSLAQSAFSDSTNDDSQHEHPEEGTCDCAPVSLSRAEELTFAYKSKSLKILVPHCEVLSVLTKGLRNMETYAKYPRDKVRGEGVIFHFTLANADSEAELCRVGNIIADHVRFPLLAGMLRGETTWKEHFMNIRWQMSVVCYDAKSETRKRRNATFSRVPGMTYTLARRKDGCSL